MLVKCIIFYNFAGSKKQYFNLNNDSMKKSILFLSAIALILTACGKPTPTPQDITVNPSPLKVVGNTVSCKITGTFPQKEFAKKAILKVTPVLKYGDQEVLGETVVYVGEKVKENGKTVNYKNGGTYSQNFSCDFKPEMAKSELYLRFEASKGKTVYEIPDLKIADGVVTTQKMASAADNKTVASTDKFQRIIQKTQEADIKFLIQQANLRSSETGSTAVKDLQTAIKDAATDEHKQINKIEVSGYASPDGGQELNEKLASQRQKATAQFLEKKMKKDKVQASIDTKVTAEDWEGFKALMENSDIKDKDLVLRVLSMYSDPEEREAQIKNLSAVFKNIADEILPQLRRSRLILTTDLIGKSDDEISALAKEDPSQLSVEELLYAASLESDINEQAKIYNKAIEQYPDDARAYNNLGLINFKQGNVAEARRCYAKALAIEPHNPDFNYNAGVAAMADNDLAKAEEYFGKAAGTSADLSSAMGTLYTMKGDYAAAKKAYGNVASNNAALQQILDEDYAAARKTLAAVKEPNATTAYLQAIVGARTNDRDAVYSNLRTAVAKDASLKAKAQTDIEFAKFQEDETFSAIVK